MIEETKNYNSFSYYTQNVREVLFLGLQRESIYITTVETLQRLMSDSLFLSQRPVRSKAQRTTYNEREVNPAQILKTHSLDSKDSIYSEKEVIQIQTSDLLKAFLGCLVMSYRLSWKLVFKAIFNRQPYLLLLSVGTSFEALLVFVNHFVQLSQLVIIQQVLKTELTISFHRD